MSRWPALALGLLIGVMRSWVIAQHRHSSLSRAAEEVTSLAVFRRPGAASEAWA